MNAYSTPTQIYSAQHPLAVNERKNERSARRVRVKKEKKKRGSERNREALVVVVFAVRLWWAKRMNATSLRKIGRLSDGLGGSVQAGMAAGHLTQAPYGGQCPEI